MIRAELACFGQIGEERKMNTLEYFRKLAKETEKWYVELNIDGNRTMPPTREEWAKHFGVSVELYPHVAMEMNPKFNLLFCLERSER
jgi:hypothetical protein